MPTPLYIMEAMSRKVKNKLSPKDLEMLRHIRNTLMHTGKSPSVRELQNMMEYKSPRSITVILKRLMNKGFVARRADDQLVILHEPEIQNYNASTIDIPLVGLAACGTPLLAEEHIQAMVPVSTQLARSPYKYFLLRACGDSMNLAGIEDGDFVLVRQQAIANNGDIVVALIDSEITIKRMRREKFSIVLEPVSNNKDNLPIVLQSDFHVQGVVVQSLGKLYS